MDPEKRDKAVIRKLNAEAAKAEAEAVRLAAEAEMAQLNVERERQRLEVEMDKIKSEAAKLEAEAAVSQITLAREKRKEEKELATNEYHHVYHFTSQVNGSTVQFCMDRLTYWARTEPGCAIEIVFTSPGGSVIEGLALFDFIQDLRRAGHHITTKALGMAASMAGILLQAGDKRVMSKESYVLIHEISTGAIGKIGEIEDEVKFVKKIQGRILEIFAARSKVPKSYYAKHWKRQDWWLDSAECLKIGFVDEVQ
jgi:ATP-dependent Clp endopeptidase proteolytic subunit ClpP